MKLQGIVAHEGCHARALYVELVPIERSYVIIGASICMSTEDATVGGKRFRVKSRQHDPEFLRDFELKHGPNPIVVLVALQPLLDDALDLASAPYPGHVPVEMHLEVVDMFAMDQPPLFSSGCVFLPGKGSCPAKKEAVASLDRRVNGTHGIDPRGGFVSVTPVTDEIQDAGEEAAPRFCVTRAERVLSTILDRAMMVVERRTTRVGAKMTLVYSKRRERPTHAVLRWLLFKFPTLKDRLEYKALEDIFPSLPLHFSTSLDLVNHACEAHALLRRSSNQLPFSCMRAEVRYLRGTLQEIMTTSLDSSDDEDDEAPPSLPSGASTTA